MAERRMFAKTIIDSDAFLDMPLSTQCLYFHLNMRADDDGFINNPKKIQRMIGASDDDLKVLMGKNFIIPFESGIVVIKHWKIHNYIRNDRYKETVYQEEKAMLIEKENKSYSLGIPNGYQMETQVRLGKDRLGKDNIKENIKRKNPTLEEIQNYIQEKNLKVNAKQFFDYFTEGNWIDSKGNKVKNWKQKLLTWNKYNIKPIFKNINSNKQTNYNNYEQRQYSNLDNLYANKGGN